MEGYVKKCVKGHCESTAKLVGKRHTKHVNLDLNNVDHVSSNVRSSRFGAILYVSRTMKP